MSLLIEDILSLIFGILAFIMTVGIQIPQIILVHKTKNTSGTSLTSYILFLISSTLWLTWGTVNYYGNIMTIQVEQYQNVLIHVISLVPTIITNLTGTILSIYILLLKIKNVRLAKKLNITEFELSKIVFDKQKGESWLKRYHPVLIMILICIIFDLAVCLILYFTGIPKEPLPPETFDNLFKWVIFGINIAATLFYESISWPQFVKCMKTKDTSGISLSWAIFLPLTSLSCFCYDLFIALTTDYLSVIASLIFSGTIINTLVLILKIKNHMAAKKLGISEWKYTQKYIKNKRK